MTGSAQFRASVQPLVRTAVMRGASVADITAELRRVYGHAYRRADLLDDIRACRVMPSFSTSRGAISSAITTYRDIRGLVARVGVAAFSISLLLPTIVHGGVSKHVIIASTLDRPATIVEERIALPNAREARRVAVSAPSVEDMRTQPEPASEQAKPTPASPPAPVYAALPNGMNGVVVTASWYGPGFYENRLPCWPWLAANGQPIQFSADTWGVAHKTLPCGTMLTLSHGSNVIVVPVVDRGPYVAGRELDLSLRVKTALGCTDLCTVLMHIGG